MRFPGTSATVSACERPRSSGAVLAGVAWGPGLVDLDFRPASQLSGATTTANATAKLRPWRCRTAVRPVDMARRVIRRGPARSLFAPILKPTHRAAPSTAPSRSGSDRITGWLPVDTAFVPLGSAYHLPRQITHCAAREGRRDLQKAVVPGPLVPPSLPRDFPAGKGRWRGWFRTTHPEPQRLASRSWHPGAWDPGRSRTVADWNHCVVHNVVYG